MDVVSWRFVLLSSVCDCGQFVRMLLNVPLIEMHIKGCLTCVEEVKPLTHCCISSERKIVVTGIVLFNASSVTHWPRPVSYMSLCLYKEYCHQTICDKVTVTTVTLCNGAISFY